MAFEGFTREALQFLADLAANNERAWFAPRKADYERLLKLIEPDHLHVLMNGRIVFSGGPEAVQKLEEHGYDWIREQVGAEAG